jgi:acyl carrier protein
MKTRRFGGRNRLPIVTTGKFRASEIENCRKQNIVTGGGESIMSIMGLDTVEMVMAIEEEFKIEIPDSVAEELLAVGDIRDYVCKVLRKRGETVDEDVIWERVKKLVVDQLGVPPERVTPSADIIRDLGAG